MIADLHRQTSLGESQYEVFESMVLVSLAVLSAGSSTDLLAHWPLRLVARLLPLRPVWRRGILLLATCQRRRAQVGERNHMPESVKVFVSHSHADDAFTNRLVTDLRAAGVDVWVDTAAIRHDDFIRKINEGMADRQWLVLVLTPDALRSSWVQAEVNAALHRKMQGFML